MTSGRERRACRLGARLERLVGAGAGPARTGASLVTEAGRALGARVRHSTPDQGSWVTAQGVTADARPRAVHAAVTSRGARALGGGFPGLGRRLFTARWAAREGSRRLRIQLRRLIRELRAGEVTAVAVGSKSFFPKERSQLRIRGSALQVTGPVSSGGGLYGTRKIVEARSTRRWWIAGGAKSPG